MDGWRGGHIQLLFAFIVWLEQHMVSLIICKYLDIHSGWAVRKTAGIPWRHSSITFSYLNRSTEVFLHAPSQADISGDWPTNWQDVRGHTLSTQSHCRSAFGKWRLAACVGRKQRQTEGQGPVLSSPSGIQRSFVSRLNQILTTEELIKTASCATEPLCCDLASVTLACLKVPDLEAKSCFPAAACGSSGQLLSSSPGPRWLLPSTLTLQMEFGVCVMCADFILFTYLFFYHYVYVRNWLCIITGAAVLWQWQSSQQSPESASSVLKPHSVELSCPPQIWHIARSKHPPATHKRHAETK